MAKTSYALALIALFAISGSEGHSAHAQAQPQSSLSVTGKSQARLGARVLPISPTLRQHFGAPKDLGLLVDEVEPNTPAALAGLQSGDLILSVEGTKVTEAWDIYQALQDKKKGEIVKVEVLRARKRKTLKATLDGNGSSASTKSWGRGSISLGGQAPKVFQWGPGSGTNPADLQKEIEKMFPKEFQNFFGGQDGFRGLAPNGPMRDRIQELEERLQKLEGKPLKRRKQKPKSKGQKPSIPQGPRS